MNDAQKCPRCGAERPAGSADGVCPRCAAELLQATQTDLPGEGSFVPPTVAELAGRFPQLEIIELVGRGGMGAVYKARQKELDRLVALKILPPDIGRDAAFAERFSREARALAKLNHPGIVTIYDFGRTDGLYFFLMEFVDGMNLRELLHNGRISAREALAIVPQICDALQFAHDQGIVHRDIKPENLLLDRRGRVKVADFGLAKLMGTELPTSATAGSATLSVSLTEAGKVMGTPNYMAPEQKERPDEVDHRADIYALGVVFYQMLTGELPDKPLQPPSQKVHIDVRLDEVVLRALEQKPERRYQHASDVKTCLDTIANKTLGTPPVVISRWNQGMEYKTKRTLFGLPWVHVANGIDPATGRPRIARGIIAIGGMAQGGVAVGGVAMGGIAMGGLSLGVFSYGGLAGGVVAMGGLALGLLGGLGGGVVAPIAIGGLAVGYYAMGGLALGRYTMDGLIKSPAAVDFFEPWAQTVMTHFQIVNFGLIIVAMFLAILLPWWLKWTSDRHLPGSSSQGRGRRWPTFLQTISFALLVAMGLFWMLVIFGSGWHRIAPQPRHSEIHQPPGLTLADQPWALKNLPTARVIQVGLLEPENPWAWQELQTRIGGGHFQETNGSQLMDGLIGWLRRDHPQGYDQPLAWLGPLLDDLGKHHLVAETNAVAFTVAYYGNPILEPLSRLHSNDHTLTLECNLRPWNDAFFGLCLLNHMQSITVDGQPVSARNLHGRESWDERNYDGEIKLPDLAMGTHRVRCEIESALVAESNMEGLSEDARPPDWPPAELRWTRVCGAEFTVYPVGTPLVTLRDAPSLNPVLTDGLSFDHVIIRPNNGHLTAVISLHMDSPPPVPISLDVTLRLADQVVKCGSFWVHRGPDGKSTQSDLPSKDVSNTNLSGDISANIGPVDPNLKVADIILTPDPQAVESQPGVDRIWGKDIVFTNVPLIRLDSAGDGIGQTNLVVKTIQLARATNDLVGTNLNVRTVTVWTDTRLRPGEKLRTLVQFLDGRIREDYPSLIFTDWENTNIRTTVAFNWWFKDKFGQAEADDAVAQIGAADRLRAVALKDGIPLELFSVANDDGERLTGYIEFDSAPRLPAPASPPKATVRISQSGNYIFNTFIGYSAKVPPGYVLLATVNTGRAETMTSAGPDEYRSTWLPHFPRAASSLPGTVTWAVKTPPEGMEKIRLMEERLRHGPAAHFQQKLVVLPPSAGIPLPPRPLPYPGNGPETTEPFEVVLGEPKLIFSLTNASGDVWRGYLELIGPDRVSEK